MSETIKTEKPAKDDQQQFWQMALETFKSSGLSVRQFCRQEGLAEPSFYSWRKKLADADSEQEYQHKPKPSAFIEVAMPQNTPAVIELLLTSGNTLRIPAGADSATLSTVLSVVRAYKRLEEGTYEKINYPPKTSSLEVDVARLSWILEGIDLLKARRRKRYIRTQKA